VQVFDAAVVQRLEPGLGVLLMLPMEPVPAPAFAHISNLVDGDKMPKDQLGKTFKVTKCCSP
jgi:hypothetical protein